MVRHDHQRRQEVERGQRVSEVIIINDDHITGRFITRANQFLNEADHFCKSVGTFL